MFEKHSILGRVVADAQVKSTANGTKYIDMRMVVNRRAGKDKETVPIWYSVRSFSVPTSMAQYYTKGKPLIVEGIYSDKVYQTKNGDYEIDRSILAYSIEFDEAGERKQDGANAASTESTKAAEVRNPSVGNTKSSQKGESAPVQQPTVDNSKDDDLPF